MKMEGNRAVFTGAERGQMTKTPVSLSTVARNFEYTEIISSKAPDTSERIDTIRLQNTNLGLEFSH
jgi:hypothetical protein